MASPAYSSPHQALRQQWAPAVATGTHPCARCGQPIRPGQPWDLGHKDNTHHLAYSGPEHRSCNRSAGATHGNTTRTRTTAHRKPESHPGLVD